MANKKEITVAVSGGFDPIHIGHLRLFKDAKKLGTKLVVILNNDNWLKKKKGFVFMSQDERKELIEGLAGVDQVVLTSHRPDPENMGVGAELEKIRPHIFANGGDRTEKNIPELAVCKAIGCRAVFNVGRGGKVQSSSQLTENYTANLPSSMIGAFKTSDVDLPLSLKLKTAELVLNLMKSQKNFGLFVILGWQNKWQDYTDISDSTQDIFVKHHVNVAQIENHADWYREVESTVGFDGAILIDEAGEIVHSGVIIEGLHPRAIAAKVNPGIFKDLSEQFGFKQKVHSRHLFAIASSHIFKNTTVFTVSEETGALHIFEGGRIVYQK